MAIKNKISQEYEYEDNFHIVIITSQLPDYKLVWSINHQLNIHFKKFPEFLVYNAKQGIQSPYVLYIWTSPLEISYFLVSSVEKSSALFSETFVLIQKEEPIKSIDNFIEQIRLSTSVFSIEKITFQEKPVSLKQRYYLEQLSNISIDLEQHLDMLKKDFNSFFSKKTFHQ